ncbi:MAG: porin family protein [Bacteroidales bacterium]|jgi:opacity protein-like surface antigen|nr:porin family protein [Bacteroidales bacterium]
MKKILITLFLTSVSLFGFAQSHRLANGEPYDIFISLRPSFIMTQADVAKNYQWGVGTNLLLEYQFQEIKLSAGIEIGYNYLNPKTYKLSFLPRKHLWTGTQIPLTLFGNYYFTKNEKLKPYIGLGLSAMWGKYDYSLSSDANKNIDRGYYLREYEGISGWHFGIVPRCGFMFSLDHQNAFGFEVGYQYYLKNGLLEPVQNLTIAFNYTFIID